MNQNLEQLTLPLIPGYEVRPAAVEDAALICDLWNIVNEADQRSNRETPEAVEREFRSPDVDPVTDSLLVFTRNGVLAATAWVFSPPPANDASVSYLAWEVHPAFRGLGIEDALLPWLEQRGRTIQSARQTDLPRHLRSIHQAQIAHYNEVLERHGFAHIRSSYRMLRDLSQPIPDGPLPDGVRLTQWDPALSESAREAVNAAFRDHWGAIDYDEPAWHLWLIDHPDFRPDFTRLVVAEDGQVVGVCINQVRHEEITIPWVQDLSVIRAWRKHGLATAMLCDSLRVFKAAGFETAGLGVDAENLTGALRLYERLGFYPARTYRFYDKLVD